LRAISLTATGESRKGQPSVIALLFGIWALVISVGYSGQMLSTDGDLARHIVLGEHILSHGVVFPDVFSHTKLGEEFVAYEWLSEVIFATVHSWSGLAAVAILAGILIASSVGVVARYLRGRLETAAVLLVGHAVVALTYPHWLARPHLFSFLALSVLLMMTDLAPGWKRHLGLAVLFSLWANLHPGFVYGLAVYFAYVLGDTLDDRSRPRLMGNALSAAAAVLGTFATPLGWRLHHSFVHHLRDTRAFELVEEFQPIAMVSLYGVLFFLSLVLMIWILSVRKVRPPLSIVLPFFASLFAALSAQRNVPLFALFALPLMLRSTSDVVHAWRWKPLENPRRVMAADDQQARTAPYVLAVLVLLGALTATSGRVGPFQIVHDEFSSEYFPVKAVQMAREGDLHDHTLLTMYHWGGYILYAWPEQTIYIDGMANFFGSELMEEYISVLSTQEGWKDTLSRRGIDLLILPPNVKLASEVRKLPDWSVWYEDSTAVVFRYETPAPGIEPLALE